MMDEEAAAGFASVFGRRPEFVVRAPGRVNLIGDHTDYNDGLVLPIAIDRAFYVAAAPTGDSVVRVHSHHAKQAIELPLNLESADGIRPWARYVLGVLVLLRRRGIALGGAELWIGGDLPVSAGLSSSAALEVGVAVALLELAGATMPRPELADLCRRVENEFAGAPCGIMDQLCVCCAKAGHVLLIDCRNVESKPIPLNIGDARIVVIDTGVRHRIAGTEYAARRRECAEALESLRRGRPTVQSLRDVDACDLTALAEVLAPVLHKRVTHVVTENDRVRQTAKALKTGDVQTVGRLMSESHRSLRDDYEVSCAELDEVVSIAQAIDGVHGARMTGGGFGGCAIALIERETVKTLKTALHESYSAGYRYPLSVFTVEAVGAAEVLW